MMDNNVRIAKELVKLAKSLVAEETIYPTHEYIDLHVNPDGSHVIAMFVKDPEDKVSCKYCVNAIEDMAHMCDGSIFCITPKEKMVNLMQYGNGQFGYEITIGSDYKEQLQKFMHEFAVKNIH